MAKTYRVGIIGSTGRGDYGHDVDVTKVPNVQVAAVADTHHGGRAAAQKRNGAAKTYPDYRRMLAEEKPYILAICQRWIDQHHEMLLAAADAGCHVYIEKPFWRMLGESDDVVPEMEMRHLKLGIAYVSQYSPVLEVVVSLIRNGVIGDILEIRGRGKEDRLGGGEDLCVLGSHVFGVMRSLAGDNVQARNDSQTEFMATLLPGQTLAAIPQDLVFRCLVPVVSSKCKVATCHRRLCCGTPVGHLDELGKPRNKSRLPESANLNPSRTTSMKVATLLRSPILSIASNSNVRRNVPRKTVGPSWK